MQFYSHLDEIKPCFTGSLLTIGNFDGVHRGHRAILEKVTSKAKSMGLPSALLTFDPHPIQVLFPERQLRRLFSVKDLREQVEKLGIEALIIQPFDKTFAKLSADAFLRSKVLPPLHPRELVVGHDFNFGADRSGTLEFLSSWCTQKKIDLTVQSPVEVNGERVSSRRIREMIAEGNVRRANLFLGRPFYVEGVVEKGAGRGRTLGIPTINVKLGAFVQPKIGVYVSEAIVGDKRYRSVSNLGLRPTFGPDFEVNLETHIFAFNGEIYGHNVRVELLHFLRDEKKFASVDDLRAQIQVDMQAAQHFQGTAS